MPGFRENRISIVDLFPSMSVNANAKQASVDRHCNNLPVSKGRGSKTNT